MQKTAHTTTTTTSTVSSFRILATSDAFASAEYALVEVSRLRFLAPADQSRASLFTLSGGALEVGDILSSQEHDTEDADIFFRTLSDINSLGNDIVYFIVDPFTLAITAFNSFNHINVLQYCPPLLYLAVTLEAGCSSISLVAVPA